MAEKAAWDYQRTLPKSERFDIVTLLPARVMGPNLRADWFASGDWVKSLMEGDMPEIDFGRWAAVDVRDVAFAHL